MTTTPTCAVDRRAVDPAATLGALVTDRPALARHLERLGLDYCCGGRRTLADACHAAGLELDAVVAALTLHGGPADPAPWATMDPAQLVDHLEATHHAYLHAELPRLAALADRVVAAHGGRHPELAEVRPAYAELQADLVPHLMKEERVLFPMVRELVAARAAGAPAPAFHCGTLRHPVSVMLAEHDRAGELLGRLRHVTADFTPPADACASYRGLYEGLAELEADTHLHVHKENNVLFPVVLAMEASAG
jgi:regulator of cell morphogenesis and NO signaling